jgi:hypothetical protein
MAIAIAIINLLPTTPQHILPHRYILDPSTPYRPRRVFNPMLAGMMEFVVREIFA